MIELKEGDLYEGQIIFSTNGNGHIIIEENDIFIYKKNTLNSLHLDIVSVEIFRSDRSDRLEGKVIKTISRFKKKFTGKVSINKNNTFVIPDNNKIPVDFYIKGGLVAKQNQKVIIELTKWSNSKSPQAKIIEILGDSGNNNAEMNSIMFEYDLPIDFTKDVIHESELISEVITEKEIMSRKDIRNITTITIDPEDAKDFDDAISVNIINDNIIEIGVHIADVSHYIIPGSKLDEESFNRSTSVYLVDRCVPMLPERLSNGICSLKPNEDRLTFSVIFTINKMGDVLNTWHGKTIIHSDRKYSYEEAQEIIEGVDGDFHKEIRLLNDISKKLRVKRMKNGSIDIGGVEVRFILDVDKKPIGVYFKEQKDSNKLIEEYMLLANKAIAEFIKSRGFLCVNRIHENPNSEKLMEIKKVAEVLGHDFSIDDAENIKSSISKLLKDIEGTPEENLLSTLVIRSQKKAIYSTKNIPHYGLGFKDYCHFTSPIRRYSDILIHRILDGISKGKYKNIKNLEDMCSHISEKEQLSAKAQRDSIKYKQAEYLMDKIGEVFEGIVSGITEWGMYVELIESKCEGMIKYDSLVDDWIVDSGNFLIYNSTDKIRLGDSIKISVASINLDKKQIDFIKYE